MPTEAQRRRWIEQTLANDESSTDEELVEYFRETGGLTEEEARGEVARRDDVQGRV